jgi:hypothetical protein
MHLGVAVVVLILMLLAPALWVAWWLLADLGQRAQSTSAAQARRDTWRAA